MRLLIIVSKSIAFSLAMLCACLVHAESPFARPKIERYRVDLIDKPEWVEASRIEEMPEQLVIQLVDATHRPIDIARFIQDGDAAPELVNAFKEKVHACSLLFLIIKWHYYIPGSATEADYFEVHAYEVPPRATEQGKLVESESITKYFGSGFDGRKEGRSVHFQFKNANAVRQALAAIDTSRWNVAPLFQRKSRIDCKNSDE